MEKTALRSAILPKEIPEIYHKNKLIGKGKTAIVLEDTENPNKVLVFTRDRRKVDWLLEGIGYKINKSKMVSEIKGKPELLKKTTTELKLNPIYIIRMDRLKKLSRKNRQILTEEFGRFSEIKSKALSQFRTLKKSEVFIKEYVIETYLRQYPEGILAPFMKWSRDYDPEMFEFDFHMKNFLQTEAGEIVILDPVLETETLRYIMYE